MLKKAGIGFIGTTLLLTACGDESGSSSNLTYDGPTAPIGINAENADTVAALAGDLVLGPPAVGATAMYGVAVEPVQDGSAVPALPALVKLTKKINDLALTTAASSGPETLVGVGSTETVACDGGGTKSITATFDQNDPFNTISDGDSADIVFRNCVMTNPVTEVTTKTNGSTSTHYTSVNFVDGMLGSMSMNSSYNNLKETVTSTGDYLWLNGSDLLGTISVDGSLLASGVSGSSLVFESRTNGVVEKVMLTDFSLTGIFNIYTYDASFEHDFTVASEKIGGAVSVDTINPFTIYFPNSYPSVGQMVISGTTNVSLKLTAVDETTVSLEYDINGNGIYGDGTDPVMKMIAWSDL